MKKIALIIMAALLLMLPACGQAPAPGTDTDSDSEPQPALLEINGYIESWENDLLTVLDEQGALQTFTTGAAEVSGDHAPEAGCPVTVTVAEDAPEDALEISVLGPPREVVRARQILESMGLEEKVGQMFLARCPEYDGAEEAARLHLGGYVLFDRDFAYYGFDEAKARIASYQQAADLPMFMAVDEEGGEVVRISCYPAYRYERFASPREVYAASGLEGLAADAREKAALLLSLGVNVDLAPVADVSTSPYDFIYSRALGEDAETTARGVAAIVQGLEQVGVSACLKHFPGYGDNGDTHSGVEIDYREASVFYEQDLLPFRAGIEAGADFVLVSHNIVAAFDGQLPASLSPAVHGLLRDELGFSGLIITDDLAMEGVAGLYGVDETAVLAVLAGNDMLLSSDPEEQIDAVLQAVETGRISQELIDSAVERILLTKIKAGLIPLSEPAAAEDAAA
ncbi:MAG: beta-hexosaminidase [Firmicutes bacterium]|nr:beta-hexosaminidase [Bacillota bacterium]